LVSLGTCFTGSESYCLPMLRLLSKHSRDIWVIGVNHY
jgi:hypothetical protein